MTPDVEISQREARVESSDDDDLFDNLRKMRENNMENVINKSGGSKSNEITRNRKRTRSDSDDEDTSRGKMQKIDEGDESVAHDDDDDILSFAKRTLQHEDLPDSEDIISNIPKLVSGKYTLLSSIYKNCPLLGINRSFLAPIYAFLCQLLALDM